MKTVLFALFLIVIGVILWKAATRPIPWKLRHDDPAIYLLFRDFAMENRAGGEIRFSNLRTGIGALRALPTLADDWSVDLVLQLDSATNQNFSLTSLLDQDKIDSDFDIIRWSGKEIHLVSNDANGALNLRRSFAVVSRILGEAVKPEGTLVVRQMTDELRTDGIARARILREQDAEISKKEFVYWSIDE